MRPDVNESVYKRTGCCDTHLKVSSTLCRRVTKPGWHGGGGGKGTSLCLAPAPFLWGKKYTERALSLFFTWQQDYHRLIKMVPMALTVDHQYSAHSGAKFFHASILWKAKDSVENSKLVYRSTIRIEVTKFNYSRIFTLKHYTRIFTIICHTYRCDIQYICRSTWQQQQMRKMPA